MTAPAATHEASWPGPILLAACMLAVAAGLLFSSRTAQVSSGPVQVTTFSEVAPAR